jgi:hypothetical protein
MAQADTSAVDVMRNAEARSVGVDEAANRAHTIANAASPKSVNFEAEPPMPESHEPNSGPDALTMRLAGEVASKAYDFVEKNATATWLRVRSRMRYLVRHHPERIIAFAAGAGLVIGVLLRVRKSNQREERSIIKYRRRREANEC